ncbi:MAG: hypothetical protein SO072_07925 [Dysosmobacter sp.]|nr:hypothetical protein [Dysosmobacter sp.]
MEPKKKLDGVNPVDAEKVVDSVASADTGNKRGKKPLFIAVIGVIFLMILVVSLVGGRKAMDMRDYIQVNFSGLNNKGRAELLVDYSAMVQKLPKKDNAVSQEDALQALFGDLASSIGYRALIESAVKCELDKSSGLSNGDKVTVSVQVNDERCKELGIKIKQKPLAFSVDGLKEVETFDAFADITVVFDGISPKATAKVINNSRDEACLSYRYSLDRESGLAIGDTVTVSISESNIDAVAENTGKAPAKMEKSFTVDGVSRYVSELSQIPDTALTGMQKEATDILAAYIAREWAKTSTLESTTYIGSYLLTRKPNSSGRDQNQLYLVHEVTCGSNYDGADAHIKYYYYTAFTNVVVHDDGNVSWGNCRTAAKRYTFDVHGASFYVYGYETLAELFNDCVMTRVDNYAYSSSITQ